MAFFSVDNPMLSIAALILVVALLRGWLGTFSFFKKNAVLIVPIIIVIALMLVSYTPLLAVIGASASMINIVLMFVAFIFFVLIAIGVNDSKVLTVVKEVGFLKLSIIIVVACIFILAFSQVYGEKLLKEPKVSFSEGFAQGEDTSRQLDLSPVFSAKFLGLMLVLGVLGMFFFWVLLR